MNNINILKPQKIFRIPQRRLDIAKSNGFLIIHSPNDNRWHIYSDYLDMFLYESFCSEDEAKRANISTDTIWTKEDL